MSSKTLYLDHVTATRPSEQAVGRMLPFLTDQWGASSSPHRMGQRLQPAIHEAYQSLYKLLGAPKDSTIVFTSCGAEAVNQVIHGVYLDVMRTTGKNQFVTGAADEAPAIMAISSLEPLGCVSRTAALDKRGRVTAEAIADVLSPRTALVSLSWANGLTGVVNQVAEIAALCRERGVLLHLEATHVLGKLVFELADIGADFITFNGDSLHAPKGTGALYIREGMTLSPLIIGGLSQGGLRGGELNVPALVGLGVACREALEARDLLGTEVARLRNRLEEGLVAGYPGAVVCFGDAERLPHISSVVFPGVVNEALLFALSRQGVCCSMGGGIFQQIGIVLEAGGVAPALAHCGISFGLARTTLEEEIDRAVEVVCATAKQLQRLSLHLLEEVRL